MVTENDSPDCYHDNPGVNGLMSSLTQFGTIIIFVRSVVVVVLCGGGSGIMW